MQTAPRKMDHAGRKEGGGGAKKTNKLKMAQTPTLFILLGDQRGVQQLSKRLDVGGHRGGGVVVVVVVDIRI